MLQPSQGNPNQMAFPRRAATSRPRPGLPVPAYQWDAPAPDLDPGGWVWVIKAWPCITASHLLLQPQQGMRLGSSTAPRASLGSEVKASTPFKAHPWIKLLVTPAVPHPGVGSLLQVLPTRGTGLLGTRAGTEPSQGATAGAGPVAFSLEIWAEAHVCSSCFNTSRARTHILHHHHHLQKLSSSSDSSDHRLYGHMGGQRGPEQPQFLRPLPRAS